MFDLAAVYDLLHAYASFTNWLGGVVAWAIGVLYSVLN